MYSRGLMSAANPVYLKMRDDLRGKIERGELSPGESLPSENDLAVKYGISRSSARLALAELEAEKLIERKSGKSTIVLAPSLSAPISPPKLIGLDITADTLAGGSGYYAEFATGAMAAGRELNCQIQLVDEEYLMRADANGLAGLIIIRHSIGERLQNLSKTIPIVRVNKWINDRGKVNCVSLDDTHEAFRATEYLIQQGHTRIAFLGGIAEDGLLRLRGYVSAMKTYGVPPAPELIITQKSVREISDELRQLLTKSHPTALLVASGSYLQWFAEPVLRELHDRIPEELSVLTFDDMEDTMKFHYGPPFTCVRQPLAAMGQAAVKIIANYKGVPVREKFTAELVIRQSCRSLKRPAIVKSGI